MIISSDSIINNVLDGDVSIKQPSKLKVNGVVNGTINNNGILEIAGTVTKLNNLSNNLSIKKNAIVNGKRY